MFSTISCSSCNAANQIPAEATATEFICGACGQSCPMPAHSANDIHEQTFPISISEDAVAFLLTKAKADELLLPEFRLLFTSSGVDFATEPAFDPASDISVEHGGLYLFMDRRLAVSLQGWRLVLHTTLAASGILRLLPPPGRSTAGAPGRLQTDRKLIQAVQTELAGFSGWLWRRRDSSNGTRRYEGTFEAIARDVRDGDTRAAMVVHTTPDLLVAAYSDEFDCIAMLRFSKRIAVLHKLNPGDRLVTCNTYAVGDWEIMKDLWVGPGALMNQKFFNFRPVIGQFVSSDNSRLATLLERVPTSEWQRVQECAEEWQEKYQAGIVKPRLGAPLWSYAPADKPPTIDASLYERAAAAMIDLLLVTAVCVSVWTAYSDFGQIVQDYLRQPRAGAARDKFLAVRNEIRNASLLVFIVYCTVMHCLPWRATIGKLLIGIKVVKKHQVSGMSVMQSIFRTLFLAFGMFGAAWSLLRSGTHQAIHDLIANTSVLRVVK